MALRASALSAFMAKELRHILRDRQTLIILLLLPLAMVVLFGFALRTEVNHIRTVFVDPVPDYATTALRNRFLGNGRFDLVANAGTVAAVGPLFRRGDADVAGAASPLGCRRGFSSSAMPPIPTREAGCRHTPAP